MAYTSEYNYLTVHWKLADSPETGQFGLKFIGPNVPDQAMVDGAAPAVQTFWSAALSYITPGISLTHLRLARLGTDGKYLPESISYDHTYAPAISGGGAATTNVAQTAHVITLRTGVPRGLAHAGRVYIPPLAFAPNSSDYLWPIANINNRLNGFSTMLSALSGSDLGILAVMSKGTPTHPLGATNNVTYINSDTRPDVQRRRARSLTKVISANWNVLI